jgi:hypothetical protein
METYLTESVTFVLQRDTGLVSTGPFRCSVTGTTNLIAAGQPKDRFQAGE